MNTENLIQNGDFGQVVEGGQLPLGWELDEGEEGAIIWGVTDEARGGGRALVVESPDLVQASVCSPEFSVRPKTTYALSFWTRSDEPATFGVYLGFDSHSAGLTHYDASPKAAEEWSQVSGVFPSLAESNTCQVRFRLRDMRRLYLCDVRLTEVEGNPWYGMCEKTPLSQLRLPSERPFLYFTRDELEILKAAVESESWAKQNYESVLSQAEGWLDKGSYEVPEQVLPTVGRVRVVSHHLPRPLALAYGLTGDLCYAQKTREALLYLCDLRPEGGMGRGKGDFGYTCGYAMAGLAMMYDLVHKSGVFSGEDRARIEDTMRASFEGMRLSSDNMKFHNRAAVCLGGMAAIAFCLQDEAMIDWVLNGAYGFHRHMTSVPEDGLWEEGPGYAYMTFGSMAECAGYMGVAECAYHAGVNLYQDPNLRKLLVTPMNCAFPDMTLAGHGHADAGGSVVDRAFSYVRPYLRTGDSAYGWVIREAYEVRGEDRSESSLNLWAGAVSLPKEVDFAPTFGTTHFHSRGLVMLRTGEGMGAINVLFDYGYTGGHAHPDKLNIGLYANGQVQVPDGIQLYTAPEAFTYNGTPVGHNTVVVDELAQHTSEEQHLAFLGQTPTVQVADAVDSEAYSDVHLRRTLMLTESYLVDFFRVEGDRTHRYDWVYHNLGQMSTDLPLRAHKGSLGVRNGYNHIGGVSKAHADGSWSVTCTVDEEKPDETIVVTMPGIEPTEVIFGSGPGVFRSRPDEKMPLMLARRFCRETLYTAVIEPRRGRPGVRDVSLIQGLREGGYVDPSRAAGLVVQTEAGLDHFLITYECGSYSFGEIRFEGEILALSVDHGGVPRSLYAVNTKAVGAGHFAVTMETRGTVYLERQASGSYRLQNQGREPVGLDLRLEALARPVVHVMSPSSEQAGQAPCTVEDGHVAFTAAAEGWYEITSA